MHQDYSLGLRELFVLMSFYDKKNNDGHVLAKSG